MMRRPGKCLLPVRMIPWDEDYLHVAAMVLFGSNYTVYEWMKGEPMPEGFVETLTSAIHVKQSEVKPTTRTGAFSTAPQLQEPVLEA